MTISGDLSVLSRADLHVHSWHSKVNGDLPFFRSRDCYSSPVDVYRDGEIARHGHRDDHRSRFD